MNPTTPIRSGFVQQAQHDPQQTDSQKNDALADPPKNGSQADHPYLYKNKSRISDWARNASHTDAHPKTSDSKRPPAHEDCPTPFQIPSTAPHIALLENLYDQRKFGKLLPMLGRLTAKCAKKALTQKEWKSAYRLIEAATMLNDQCRNNLKKEHAPENFIQHIITIAEALESVLGAVQRNRALFARIRTFLR